MWEAAKSPLTSSGQLELELGDARLNLPWGGRSPRGLTRVALSSIFEAQAVQKHKRHRDPRQMDLFARAVKGPPVYRGAPLLVPLR